MSSKVKNVFSGPHFDMISCFCQVSVGTMAIAMAGAMAAAAAAAVAAAAAAAASFPRRVKT